VRNPNGGDNITHRMRAPTREDADAWCRQLSVTLSAITKPVRRERPAATAAIDLPVDAVLSAYKASNSVPLADCESLIAARDAEIVSLRAQVLAMKQLSIASRRASDRALSSSEALNALRLTLSELRAAAVDDPALTARERLSVHAMAVFNEVRCDPM
jgi:hypothetical protein